MNTGMKKIIGLQTDTGALYTVVICDMCRDFTELDNREKV